MSAEKEPPLTIGEMRKYIEGEPDEMRFVFLVEGMGRKPGTWYESDELSIAHTTNEDTGEQFLSVKAEHRK